MTSNQTVENKEQSPSVSSVITSIALDHCPVINSYKNAAELVTGKDSITGEELSTSERALSALSIIPIVGIIKRPLKLLCKLVKGAIVSIGDLYYHIKDLKEALENQKKEIDSKNIYMKQTNNNQNNLLSKHLDNYTGNILHTKNSCRKSCMMQDLLHVFAEPMERNINYQLNKNGKPNIKSFKEMKKVKEEKKGLFNAYLDILDNAVQKSLIKDNTNLITYNFDSYYAPSNEGIGESIYYPTTLESLSIDSLSIEIPGAGGSLSKKFEEKKLKEQIILNKKTVLGDIIEIQIRRFYTCMKCFETEIEVEFFGNICINMNDYLSSIQKSKDSQNKEKLIEVLKYYFMANNFSSKNSKKLIGDCDYCNEKNTELCHFKEMSILPEVLIINLDWIDYYKKKLFLTDYSNSFHWLYQENLSLKEFINIEQDCEYELASFTVHDYFWGHYLSYQKIKGKWYFFNDLYNKPGYQINPKKASKIIKKRLKKPEICPVKIVNYCYKRKIAN